MAPPFIVNTAVCAAAVRHQAETLMEQASRTSGASAVVPLSVAAAAFRRLQDGVRAAEAGSRLIQVRFCHALEQLFEQLLGEFQYGLEAAFESLAPGSEKWALDLAGPGDSIRYFRLVLAEAEDLEGVPLKDEETSDILRYARRFVDRAECGRWDDLIRWSVSRHPMAAAISPGARAGLHLFEAWLQLGRLRFERVSGEIEEALRALQTNHGTEPVPFSWEKSGHLHYYAGVALSLPPAASMGELQKAALHFHDSRSSWDRAGRPSQAARELQAQTYRRLARDHTEGNPALRAHFEKQASRVSMDPEPFLPEARVVRRPRRSGYFSWLPRFWR